MRWVRLSWKHTFNQNRWYLSSGQKCDFWTRNLPISFFPMPWFLIVFWGSSFLFAHRKIASYFHLRLWVYINQKLKLGMQDMSLGKDWAFLCSFVSSVSWQPASLPRVVARKELITEVSRKQQLNSCWQLSFHHLCTIWETVDFNPVFN